MLPLGSRAQAVPIRGEVLVQTTCSPWKGTGLPSRLVEGSQASFFFKAHFYIRHRRAQEKVASSPSPHRGETEAQRWESPRPRSRGQLQIDPGQQAPRTPVSVLAPNSLIHQLIYSTALSTYYVPGMTLTLTQEPSALPSGCPGVLVAVGTLPP